METRAVATLVVRTERAGRLEYLLARRTADGHWEFVGGKREPGETIREAARRELDEELASVPPDAATVRAVADPYPSSVDERFRLHPVLVDLPRPVADGLGPADLSGEHSALAWITLDEFDDYDTLGQREALSRLDLLDGT